MSVVIVEKRERHAVLTISREKALNALNGEVLAALIAAMADLEADGAMRGVVITGAGEKAFVAGADIAAMRDLKPAEASAFAAEGHRAMNAVAESRLISIADVNGFALGGGLELALACDLRIVAENAKLGLPEVTLGLIPGFGGTQRLPRVVGRGIALEMILSGDMIDATRAAQIGLANRVVASGSALAEAEGMMKTLSTHRSAVAQRAARQAVYEGADTSLAKGLEREIDQFANLFKSDDPRLGMGAFLEKRKPEF